MTSRHSLLTLGAAVFFALGTRAEAASQVTIAAADVDRIAIVGSVPLPGFTTASMLRDAAGRLYPLQRGSDGSGAFLIPELRAGQRLVLALVDGSVAPDRVTTGRTGSSLDLAADGHRILTFQKDREWLPRADIDVRYKRAAYLHPIVSPAGAVVSGNFPANHPHHHGIWSSWSKVVFQGRPTNFWETVEQKGNTEFVALDRTWSGPVHGGFVARQQMIDLTGSKPIAAVNESWEVTALALEGVDPVARVFDLIITQTAATADPVVFSKHLYGGVSFRGRDEWNGKDALVVLTSEGGTTREAANMTRVRWCYFGGTVEGGGLAGIAILSHPENLHAPQPIRVHPEMPYVAFSPVQLGDITLVAGKPYVARYRYVVFDGPPDRARLDAYWNGYAHPAQASVGDQLVGM